MYSPQPSKPVPHKKRWSRRKKTALVIILLMILTPLAAGGYYVWDIARTIEDVQDDTVVAFPTSDYQLGGVSVKSTTATPPATAAGHTEVPPARPTQNASSVTPTTTTAPTIAAPTATAAIEAPQKTVTPEPTEQPARANPGSLDIARGIFGTGTGTDRVDIEEAWPGRDHINILVLGIDAREDGSDQNADVIMIARFDFTANEVRVVSVPRDLQVEVPDHGTHKINAAYNIGIENDPDNEVAGVIMMRDTIQYNFGIPIDEFVLVDFQGFEDVIDAVGGITITVPERIEDDTYPTEDFGTRTLIIEAGKQTMDGETALAYARTRHQDNDDQRRERQMLVLRALLAKVQSLGSVTRVSQIISATGDAFLTSIDWKEQLALANVGLKMDQNHIVMENVTEPLVTPSTSDSDGWIYVGDPVEIGDFIEAVLSGTYSPGDGT